MFYPFRSTFVLAVALAAAGFAYAGPRDARQLARKLVFEAQAAGDDQIAEAVDVLVKSKTFLPKVLAALAEPDGPAAPTSGPSDARMREAAERYCEGHADGFHRYSGDDLGWELGPIQWDEHRQSAVFTVRWSAHDKLYDGKLMVDAVTFRVKSF